MARPKLPDNERLEPFVIRLSPRTIDTVYRVASQRGEPACVLMRRAIDRLFRNLEITASSNTCYAEIRSISTATVLVAESPTRQACQDSEPVSPSAVIARDHRMILRSRL